MFIIDSNNVIVDISDNIESTTKHIKVSKPDGDVYYMKTGHAIINVPVPEGIIPQKYLYINGSFEPNSNYNMYKLNLEKDKAQIIANGIDYTTIKVTVHDHFNNLESVYNGEIPLKFDELIQNVKVVSGIGTLTVKAEVSGTYMIETLSESYENAKIEVIAV
jgi:hypothetical protein